MQSLLGALGELVDACDELGATALEKARGENHGKMLRKAPEEMGKHGDLTLARGD